MSLIISQDHFVMCLSMVAAAGPWHLVSMIASSCNSSSNLEMQLSKQSMQYDVYGVPSPHVLLMETKRQQDYKRFVVPNRNSAGTEVKIQMQAKICLQATTTTFTSSMKTETSMPKIIYGSSSGHSKETCHSSQVSKGQCHSLAKKTSADDLSFRHTSAHSLTSLVHSLCIPQTPGRHNLVHPSLLLLLLHLHALLLLLQDHPCPCPCPLLHDPYICLCLHLCLSHNHCLHHPIMDRRITSSFSFYGNEGHG